MRIGAALRLVGSRGNMKTRVRELLTHGIVKFLGNLRALPFLSVYHFCTEPFHSLAAGRKTVEHLVDGFREPCQLVVCYD